MTSLRTGLTMVRWKDFHIVTHSCHIKQLDDISVPETDATVACRLANLILTVGSMDIDVSLEGVRIDGLQPFKTQDSC